MCARAMRSVRTSSRRTIFISKTRRRARGRMRAFSMARSDWWTTIPTSSTSCRSRSVSWVRHRSPRTRREFIHGIINDTDPKGWSTQLRDEPGLVIQYERSLKLIPPQSVFGLFFDAEPHYGIAVGNVYDYVNVGGMARLGFNLPKDYGPLRIDPSLPGSGYYEPTGDVGAYVFGGVDGRADRTQSFSRRQQLRAQPQQR